MFEHEGSVSLLDGVSTIYLLSTATLFLAIIIAFYCANLLKENDSCSADNATVEVEKNINNQNLDNSERQDCVITDSGQWHNQQNLTDNEDGGSEEGDLSENGSRLPSNGLVSKLKSARLRELQTQLSEQQLEEEHRIEREQLAAIFELLKKQETELNTQGLDQTEFKAQLRLYR